MYCRPRIREGSREGCPVPADYSCARVVSNYVVRRAEQRAGRLEGWESGWESGWAGRQGRKVRRVDRGLDDHDRVRAPPPLLVLEFLIKVDTKYEYSSTFGPDICCSL